MLALKLDPEIERRLEEVAAQNGQTKLICAQDAILTYLEDWEDARTAELAIEAFEKGDRKTFTLAEMMQKYGMDDCVHTSS